MNSANRVWRLEKQIGGFVQNAPAPWASPPGSAWSRAWARGPLALDRLPIGLGRLGPKWPAEPFPFSHSY